MRRQRSFRTYLLIFIGVFVSLFTVVFLVGAVYSFMLSSQTLIDTTLTTTSHAVQELYDARGQELFRAGFSLSAMAAMRENLSQGSLQSEISRLQSVYGVDIVVLLDSQGRGISSVNQEFDGTLELNGLVRKTIDEALPFVSTEIVALHELQRVYPEALLHTRTRRIPSLYKSSIGDEVYETDGLAQVVVLPIKKQGEVVAVLAIVDILNKDTILVSSLKRVTNFDATLYLKDVAVSTTLLTQQGNAYIGTLLPDQIAANVLIGKRVSGRMRTQDGWMSSGFVPLFNHRGDAVASIRFDVPEARIKRLTLLSLDASRPLVLASLMLFLIIVSFFFAALISNKMTQPIHELIDSIDKASEGNLDQGVSSDTFEEMAVLAKHYNALIRQVRKAVKRSSK